MNIVLSDHDKEKTLIVKLPHYLYFCGSKHISFTVSTNNEATPIFISDYNYDLPDERIAKYPLPIRDSSKLLFYQQSEIQESDFSDIGEFIPENTLLVYNNTRVIQARMLFQKITGAQIEIFCLEPDSPADYAQSLGSVHSCIWKCMIGNLKKWKEGALTKKISIANEECELKATLVSTEGNTHKVHFEWNNNEIHFADILESAGELPIPPYLHRKTEESDLKNYQTVYSKIKGSVAAPTAGLHFTDEVFESLKNNNVQFEEVTLHVGAGTFQPVKTRDIAEHHMHTEVISVQRKTIEKLIANYGQIVAVGTTSVRTLESLYYIGVQLKEGRGEDALRVSQWTPYNIEQEYGTCEMLKEILKYLDRMQTDTLHADTQIMIRPGYKFRVINGMITNFHQPKSTLLLLVSAFVDGNWKNIYDYAMSHDFRFLSYGDSSLLLK